MYAQRGRFGWLCPKNEAIDSKHLGMEDALEVVRCKRKLLRPAACTHEVFSNTSEPITSNPHVPPPHHLHYREGITWLAPAKDEAIDSKHLGIDGCLRGCEMQKEASQNCHIPLKVFSDTSESMASRPNVPAHHLQSTEQET